MVEIIGYDISKIKRLKCEPCGAILEYTDSDIKVATNVDYDKQTKAFSYIDCPSCKSKIKLKVW